MTSSSRLFDPYRGDLPPPDFGVAAPLRGRLPPAPPDDIGRSAACLRVYDVAGEVVPYLLFEVEVAGRPPPLETAPADGYLEPVLELA